MAESMRVEAYAGPSAAPCAVIIVEGLSTETTVQVTRTVAGRTTTVRGGKNLLVLGASSLVDYDVPLGVEVTYEVVTPTLRLSSTYRVESQHGWITDPYDPSVAISVASAWSDSTADLVLRAATALSATRDASVDTAQVLGDRYPVAVGGTRMAPAQVPIILMALTDRGRVAMDGLAEMSPLAVLRLPPTQTIRVIGPIEYVAIARMTQSHQQTIDGSALTTLSGEMTVVRPISRAVVWEAWTYEAAITRAVDGDDVPLTYDQVATLAQLAGWTYADYARDPTIGGAL